MFTKTPEIHTELFLFPTRAAIDAFLGDILYLDYATANDPDGEGILLAVRNPRLKPINLIGDPAPIEGSDGCL